MASKPTPKPPATISFPKPIRGAADRALNHKADRVIQKLRTPKPVR